MASRMRLGGDSDVVSRCPTAVSGGFAVRPAGFTPESDPGSARIAPMAGDTPLVGSISVSMTGIPGYASVDPPDDGGRPGLVSIDEGTVTSGSTPIRRVGSASSKAVPGAAIDPGAGPRCGPSRRHRREAGVIVRPRSGLLHH